MARPVKQGIDYFPFDVDFFQDLKVRKIMKSCGSQSASILIRLLCNIYKEEGYYVLWDEDLPFLISDDLVGVTEGAVNEVIVKAIQVGFFDKRQAEENKILTSNGIQSRFKSIVVKRKDVRINNEFLVNDVNNSINDVNNPIKYGESTQRKGKESKGNKEGEKNEIPTPENPIFETFMKRYEIPLEDCKKQLLSDELHLHRLIQNLKLDTESLKNWINQFFIQLENEGVSEKSIMDAKSHFGRWIIIKLEKQNGKEQQKSNVFSA